MVCSSSCADNLMRDDDTIAIESYQQPRIARILATGLPDQVTQRCNRRRQTFFCNGDYEAYLGMTTERCSF